MSSEVTRRPSPLTGPVTTGSANVDAQPAPGGAGASAGVPVGRPAGSVATGYDHALDYDTDQPRITANSGASSEPTTTQWREIGMTEQDVAYLRSTGMQASSLRSFYDTVAAQVSQAKNPGPVTGADPLAGTPLEGTGLLYDTELGVAFDPQTQRVFDPQTGAELDPQTGAAISTGAEGVASAPGAGDMSPGWNEQYEAAYSKLFADNGFAPEAAQILIDGLVAQNLSAAQLDAGLEFYATPDGIAQLAKMRADAAAGIPVGDMVKALAPIAGIGLAVAGAGGYAVHRGREARSASVLKQAQAAAGDPDAIAKLAEGNGTSRTAAAMFGDATPQLADQAHAGLRLALERDAAAVLKDKAATPAARALAESQLKPGVIADQVATALKSGGGITPDLTALGTKFGVEPIARESAESFANRIAQQQGVSLTNSAAAMFRDGAVPRANGNTGGANSLRPYNVDTFAKPVTVGPEWAKYRAATDNMGLGVLHPAEKFRLATAALAQGPEYTAIANAVKQGQGPLKQFVAGTGAGIAARGTTGTVASGLQGISTASLKSLTGKVGLAGVVLTAGFEVGGVANAIDENGIDSKEAGNAIGGATGRVAGNLVGFAAGSVMGSVIAGSAIGTMIPIPGVGTVVGALGGLVVGVGVSMGASKALGAVGEHVGDALSFVNEKTGIGTVLGKVNDVSNKIDEKLDEVAKSTEKKINDIVPIAPDGAVHAAVKGAEFVTKTVVNPLGAIKDAGEAAKDVGGKIVDGIKGLFS